jgi:DNA-binding NarL/FixJ family response regulator
VTRSLRATGPDLRDNTEVRADSRCDDDRVPPTLLIVDDHAGFRAFARAVLESEGFEVVGEAADAATAVTECRRLAPDIVLLDVMLPDGDGFDVCELLTHDGDGRVDVVLTSSRDAAAYSTRLATTSARGFLPKEDLTGAALLALSAAR